MHSQASQGDRQGNSRLGSGSNATTTRSPGNLDRSKNQRGTRQPGAYEIQLTVVKAGLKEILGVLQVIKPEYELEILCKLQKLMPTAQALVEETRDKEPGRILTAVATRVTNAAPDLSQSSAH